MTASIKAITARPVVVPMPEPHQTATATIVESPLVLVTAETSEAAGYAIVFTYTAAALGPTASLLENMGGLLRGDAADPREVERKLQQRFRLLGNEGLVAMAQAGIDMALWDAKARAAGMSLCAMLGGTERKIRAYGAVGYDGVKRSAEVAEAWAKRGFRGVKAKIGYPTVREDVEVVRAMRSAVGPEVALMVDYNQSLTPAEAVERARVLDGEGLAWIEEPVHAHDHAGHAQVAASARTALNAGENWWGAAEVAQAILARAVDLVMLDAMKIGGVTGWMRAAALAEAHQLPVSSHLWPEISAQLLAVSATASWLEYADWWNPILAEPLRIEDGFAVPSDKPGSGVSFREL
ncbi:MAG TPA: enolase C-terminal domain-like protein [Myxococcales bacterium]|jgi:mandelate racemase